VYSEQREMSFYISLFFCFFVSVLCSPSSPSCSISSSKRIPCDSWYRWDLSQVRWFDFFFFRSFSRLFNNQSLCEERGCCWDASVADPRKFCFYNLPATNISTVYVVQGCHFDAGFVKPIADIINLWFHTYFPLV
jgi:hypothetical protein